LNVQPNIPDSAREFLSSLGILWGIESLANMVTVEFSRRMVRSLGNCRPDTAMIRLNKVLGQMQNEKIFREVLCHEAAHAAVFLLHGKGCRPHGPEWRSLVLAARYRPRTTIPEKEVSGLAAARRNRRYLYVHHCVNCGAVFRARKTDRRWRCKTCLGKGLKGILKVVRRVVI
jgi:predicted SprT family Zn-dependent metalloprotease